MPDHRTHKRITERVDLEFVQLPHPLRVWRARLGWAAAGLTGILVVLLSLWQGQAAFQARPVSIAHRLFGNDCQQCHVVPVQTLRFDLQTTFGDGTRLEESACRGCHPRESTVDHLADVADVSQAAWRDSFLATADAYDSTCFSCHREHQGTESLTRVADDYCTNCHRSQPEALSSDRQIARSIGSFASHPEFALLRRSLQDGPEPGPLHAARKRLADFESAASNWVWQDRTQLHFNHAKHLDPRGVLMAPGASTADDSTSTVVLSCGDCHQSDAEGRYMQPIRYEQHCQECHPLSFRSPLDGEPLPLPHEAPELLHGYIRDRLAQYALEQEPEDPSQRATKNPPPRLPNKQQRGGLTAAERSAWVERMLGDVQLEIGSGEQTLRSNWKQRVIRRGCGYCHVTEDRESVDSAAIGFSWSVVPPQIPQRWFAYGRFRHDRHDTSETACETCHATVRQSQRTSDILLPSIRNCQACHAPHTAWSGNRARADCIECHEYHHGQ